jgi:outer membrane receptor for ferric coprogen and ferric-rhodotorulic acid
MVRRAKAGEEAGVGPTVPFNIHTDDKTRQHGLFGIARLNLADPLKLILSARVSWYGYWNAAGEKTMEEKAVFSPTRASSMT